MLVAITVGHELLHVAQQVLQRACKSETMTACMTCHLKAHFAQARPW